MSTLEVIETGKRQTVVEGIAQGLIRYIASEGLRAGDRLPSERQLVEMIDATRLPLREALSVLKGLGIIEARHGKGVFVKQLDLAGIFSMLSPLLRSQADIDLPRLFEARFYLEGSVAELAAANRTEDNLRAPKSRSKGCTRRWATGRNICGATRASTRSWPDRPAIPSFASSWPRSPTCCASSSAGTRTTWAYARSGRRARGDSGGGAQRGTGSGKGRHGEALAERGGENREWIGTVASGRNAEKLTCRHQGEAPGRRQTAAGTKRTWQGTSQRQRCNGRGSPLARPGAVLRWSSCWW